MYSFISMKEFYEEDLTFILETIMGLCVCCSGKMYEMCCHIFISGIAQPATAQELMRSRYTAYVRCEVSYIIHTTHPSTRGQYNPKAIKEWAVSSVWEKLEIVSTKKGTLMDTTGHVEFKAYYSDSADQKHIHHEYSTFEKLNSNWFFVEGTVY
jgi:SEC-C motif-containing protein